MATAYLTLHHAQTMHSNAKTAFQRFAKTASGNLLKINAKRMDPVHTFAMAIVYLNAPIPI